MLTAHAIENWNKARIAYAHSAFRAAVSILSADTFVRTGAGATSALRAAGDNGIAKACPTTGAWQPPRSPGLIRQTSPRKTPRSAGQICRTSARKAPRSARQIRRTCAGKTPRTAGQIGRTSARQGTRPSRFASSESRLSEREPAATRSAPHSAACGGIFASCRTALLSRRSKVKSSVTAGRMVR